MFPVFKQLTLRIMMYNWLELTALADRADGSKTCLTGSHVTEGNTCVYIIVGHWFKLTLSVD
jgi:hypothetical protein